MYEQEFLCYEKALGLKEIKTEAAISVDDVLDVKVSNGMIRACSPEISI